MNHKYLRDKSYYEDIYDKHTVEECRRFIDQAKKTKFPKSLDKDPKEKAKAVGYLFHLPLYFIKGERYLGREEFITKMMAEDEARDKFVKDHPAPTAYCPKCNKKMNLMVSELDSSFDNKLMRMVYMYRCEPCNTKKAFYSDGEPYVFKNDFCPKCQKEWDKENIKSKDKIVTKYSCPHCGHNDEYTLDFNEKPKKEPVDPNFERDKKEFCLSEKEGEEYRKWKTVDYPQMKEMVDEWKDKEDHKEIYEKAEQTKKLTLPELSDLLAKELSKSDFKELVISNTEITRDLIITFTIQDAKSGRDEGSSRSDLKKALNKILEDTNWKLMSEGVSYKLGLLTGRLRGADDKEVIYKELKEKQY